MDEFLALLEGYLITADWAPIGEPKDYHMDCIQCRQAVCPMEEGTSLVALAKAAFDHICIAST